MWAATVDQDRLQRVNSAQQQNQWHRGDRQPDAERLHLPHPTEETEEVGRDTRVQSGTWGELDVGGFDQLEAAEQLEALRRNLTELERTRSRDTQASLKRTVSGRSGLSRRRTRRDTIPRPATAPRASKASSSSWDRGSHSYASSQQVVIRSVHPHCGQQPLTASNRFDHWHGRSKASGGKAK